MYTSFTKIAEEKHQPIIDGICRIIHKIISSSVVGTSRISLTFTSKVSIFKNVFRDKKEKQLATRNPPKSATITEPNHLKIRSIDYKEHRPILMHDFVYLFHNQTASNDDLGYFSIFLLHAAYHCFWYQKNNKKIEKSCEINPTKPEYISQPAF